MRIEKMKNVNLLKDCESYFLKISFNEINILPECMT